MSLYTLPVVLYGGPLDGKEFSADEVVMWGSPLPSSMNVLVPDYETVNDETGVLYGLPFSYETYYLTREITFGHCVYKIGKRQDTKRQEDPDGNL